MTLEATLVALLEQVGQLETERESLEEKIEVARRRELEDREAVRLLRRQVEEAILRREKLRAEFSASVDGCYTRLRTPFRAEAPGEALAPSPYENWAAAG